MNVKEYIVTLKSCEYLDNFYEQMEGDSNHTCIPSRRVEVAKRRPISRNTNYYLTDEEAELLKNDPRVLSVELDPVKYLGAEITPFWVQTSNQFNRTYTTTTGGINWGLWRCSNENSTPKTWGNTSINASGTVICPLEGKNVDVVISDGCVDPNHPELAVNSDGTGGSRVIQYNWFQHRSIVEGTSNGTYVYTPYIDSNNGARTSANNHGVHVAGTVAGNTLGWARKANIYNINPYSSAPSIISPTFHFDYIRQFHLTKPVNPITGKKNPTIVNCSWGSMSSISENSIEYISYRGTLYYPPFTTSQLFNTFNIPEDFRIPVRSTSVEADIQDLINIGVIVVAAAGNSTLFIDRVGGVSYNSFIKIFANSTLRYYQRGGTPSAESTVICVGSIDSETDNNNTETREYKSWFSNYGPRVDIWSPGSDIKSSTHTGGSNDPRNSSYKQEKYSGTSMASPQVCGVLACLLEGNTNLNQLSAIRILNDQLSSNNKLVNLANNSYFKLEQSVNKLLFNKIHRSSASTILTTPDKLVGLRVTKAVKYPRIKNFNHNKR